MGRSTIPPTVRSSTSYFAIIWRTSTPLLGLTPPEELSRPILKVTVQRVSRAADRAGEGHLDGAVTSYFEWLGAGCLSRGSALRRDAWAALFRPGTSIRQRWPEPVSAPRFRRELESSGHGAAAERAVGCRRPQMCPHTLPSQRSVQRYRNSFGKVCEVRFSLASAGIAIGQDVRFQVSLWQGGLPMDALPPQGWIEFSTAEPMEWMI